MTSATCPKHKLSMRQPNRRSKPSLNLPATAIRPTNRACRTFPAMRSTAATSPATSGLCASKNPAWTRIGLTATVTAEDARISVFHEVRNTNALVEGLNGQSPHGLPAVGSGGAISSRSPGNLFAVWHDIRQTQECQ